MSQLPACLMMAGVLFADTTPVMVSLVTPVQAPSCDYDVTGLRLSLIYGECQEFTGLDIGLVNYANMVEGGLQIGIVNIVEQNGWAPVLPIVNGHF